MEQRQPMAEDDGSSGDGEFVDEAKTEEIGEYLSAVDVDTGGRVGVEELLRFPWSSAQL